MSVSVKLDRLHTQVRANKWFRYFAIFNRIALAIGFIIAGLVKIMGERFASGLSVNHPMGHYLEALYQTGYYYVFIGVVQVIAAILLLVPRTATLGAILYFPIILNIFVLSFAVRFEGSLLTSPLMVLANLYLLCWDYDKLKSIFSIRPPEKLIAIPQQNRVSNKFPVKFFGGVAAIIILVVVITNAYTIMPRNSLPDCEKQVKGTSRTSAVHEFCDCIHSQGKPLNQCLVGYENAPDDTNGIP